jgi:hypothetical protein
VKIGIALGSIIIVLTAILFDSMSLSERLRFNPSDLLDNRPPAFYDPDLDCSCDFRIA